MARWHTCNVLQAGADARRVWQFDPRNGAWNLNREFSASTGEPLPSSVVGKSWSSLWQPKLNAAWLPAENVFVRVAHFPQSGADETRSMVELQLEKLSPIPVTQAVWSIHILPPSEAASKLDKKEAVKMQTVVVTIATRSAVEEFLGKLEEDGFLADRLELPLLDQLQATPIDGDGAWIYPVAGGMRTAVVAWWYGGVLQNLDLLHLSAGADRATALKDQLIQMAWAGELEGWLTSPPEWHLVADAATAAEWEAPLRQGLDQPVEITEPLSSAELAALTARRAAEADPKTGLLPPEFASRYRQRFVDRLWMRGLLALLALYVTGCVVYFIAAGFLGYQTRAAEQQAKQMGPTYTNVLQLKARYAVLKERQELKFAALECWRVTAEHMPESLTLDSLNFADGRKLTLNGTVPSKQVLSASDFSGKLRKVTVSSQQLFSLNPADSDAFRSQVIPPGTMSSWSFGLTLKRGEGP